MTADVHYQLDTDPLFQTLREFLAQLPAQIDYTRKVTSDHADAASMLQSGRKKWDEYDTACEYILNLLKSSASQVTYLRDQAAMQDVKVDPERPNDGNSQYQQDQELAAQGEAIERLIKETEARVDTLANIAEELEKAEKRIAALEDAQRLKTPSSDSENAQIPRPRRAWYAVEITDEPDAYKYNRFI